MTLPPAAPADRPSGASRVRLSVCMIVKNEERYLLGCLESVQGLADEIVILDTGSTDRTVDLARQAGAAVYQAPWMGDFARARNAALDHCTGQWVLYLDADERLRAGQQDHLLRLLADPAPAAYTLLVRSTLSTEAGKAVQVMPYPRLFRRTPGVRFEGEVHEQIAPSILRAGGKILPSTLTIDHLGYDQGLEALQRKIERNLALLEIRLKRNERDCEAHLHIARSLLLLKDYPAAERHARAAMKPPGLSGPLMAVLCNMLAELLLKSGRPDEAGEFSRKSLTLVPRQSGAPWFLAGALVSAGKVREAVPVLEQLAAYQQAGTGSQPSIGDDIVLPPQALFDLLGRCYAATGMVEKAVEALFEAVRADPAAPSSAAKFWELHEKLGRPSLAIRHCETLIPLMPGDPRPLLYLALSRKRQGEWETSLALLDELLSRDPANAMALSWKTRWNIEKNDLATAEIALRQAEQHAVVTPELLHAAFELDLARQRYDEAANRLDSLAKYLTSGQVQTLRVKLAELASVTPVRSESAQISSKVPTGPADNICRSS